MLFDHLETECAREETVSESFPIWSTYRLQTNVSVIFSQQDVIKQVGWVVFIKLVTLTFCCFVSLQMDAICVSQNFWRSLDDV